MKTDEFYMKEVLKLAKKGLPKTFPNPLVGALIVKKGKIISKGYHKEFGSFHAESEAIRASKQNLKGAVLYVNLEPCVHFGKTPPCTDLIITAGIKKVIIAHKDPNPLVNGKGIRILREKGIEVKTGVLASEAKFLNEVYLKFKKENLPFVTLKIAQTLDGKIATLKGDSKWITSQKAREYNKKMRANFQAILVGINTILKDNPYLEAKGKYSPIKIVLDSYLRIPLNANIFKKGKVLIFCSKKNYDKDKFRLLKNKCEIILVKEKEGKLNLNQILKILAERGIISIMVEGGSKIFTSFLEEGLADKLLIYIAPKIFGGRGLLSFEGKDIQRIKNAKVLKYVRFKRVGEDFLITGYLNTSFLE